MPVHPAGQARPAQSGRASNSLAYPSVSCRWPAGHIYFWPAQHLLFGWRAVRVLDP